MVLMIAVLVIFNLRGLRRHVSALSDPRGNVDLCMRIAGTLLICIGDTRTAPCGIRYFGRTRRT
eukprot:11176462-Prorocentrum_lima.AAC.1